MNKIYTDTIAPGINWGLEARNFDVIHYREGGVERLYVFTHKLVNGTKYYTSTMISQSGTIIYELGVDIKGVVTNSQVTLSNGE